MRIRSLMTRRVGTMLRAVGGIFNPTAAWSSVWNDFFGPLLYLDGPQWFTVPLALAREVTTVGTEWNIVMAATLVAMLPPLLIYAFAQNKLMGGIASVGIRG